MTSSVSEYINLKHLYRAYNGAVAMLVLYDYMNNPDASPSEYLFDILLHAFEAIAPNSLNNLSILGNSLRGLQAAYGFFSGDSTIPSQANLADIGNHAGNIAYRTLT